MSLPSSISQSMRRNRYLVLACMFALSSCASVEETRSPGKDELIITGTMMMTEVGPGCWQLLTDEGKSFEVTGISAGELHREGLHVQVRVRELKGIGSICTVGQLVELLEIIRISY